MRAAHAPYFLDVALNVGHSASDIVIPIIFSLTSATSLMGIFTAPSLMNRFGIKRVLTIALLIDGLTMCVYGCLDIIQDITVFDSVAISVRIIQGITQSLANSSTQAAVGILYMDRLDKAIGVYRSS